MTDRLLTPVEIINAHKRKPFQQSLAEREAQDAKTSEYYKAEIKDDADRCAGYLKSAREETKKQEQERIKICVLQAIADELEFPGDMPDELWGKLRANRINTEKAMQNAVRLTKNGITERFLQALKKEGG